MGGLCAIVHFDGAPVSRSLLEKMVAVASYRGSAGIAYAMGDGYGMAHLSLGATPGSLKEHQPLVHKGFGLCLVADCRIDNRLELCDRLGADGCLETSDPTDADLILAAYLRWGVECPAYLVGDFAFVLWDQANNRLLGARDALGLKPLHFARLENGLCLATEVEQVLQHSSIPRDLDEVTMADYLVNHFDGRERNIFRHVVPVPPAHCIVATGEGARFTRYWDVDPARKTVFRCQQDYAECFGEHFRRSVSDRLRSSSRVIGVLLSGGLDSSSVAAMAQRLSCDVGGAEQVLGFSFSFPNLEACDERAYSKVVADKLGLEVDYVNAESRWLLGDASAFESRLGSPHLNWESLGHEVHRRLRDRGGKVILTGHGGDNLMQGSALVYADAVRRFQVGVLKEMLEHVRSRSVPLSSLLWRHVFRPLTHPGLVSLWRKLPGRGPKAWLPDWLRRDFVRRTSLIERLGHPAVERRFEEHARQRIYESTIALGHLLRPLHWHEWISALYGQEARHPFFDRRLVELVVSIPPRQHFSGGEGKLLLRKAMRGILPDKTRLRQDKAVFNSYYDLALREKEVTQIRRIFRDPVLARMGIVDASRLRLSFESYVKGDLQSDRGRLWYAITLELWLRRFGGLPHSGNPEYDGYQTRT